MLKRPTKEENWLNIAAEIALRSPCVERAQWGAIIVINGVIVSTGYNGTVRGVINCGIDTPCLKNLYNEPRSVSYNYCPAVHSEENVIINAARTGTSIMGGTLFLSPSINFKDKGTRPCFRCRRYSINAGLLDCWYRTDKWEPIHETIEDWKKLENDWIINLLNLHVSIVVK
jgi:dCMP deaminase